jgi:hypothetical protein
MPIQVYMNIYITLLLLITPTFIRISVDINIYIIQFEFQNTDRYQVLEARSHGADTLLLIVAILG